MNSTSYRSISLAIGSLQHKGAVETILAMNLVTETNKGDLFITATVDIIKAYNRVNRAILWQKLNNLDTAIKAIKSAYTAMMRLWL